MSKKNYDGKIFQLNKQCFNNPVPLGAFSLLQLGELGLEVGEETIKHNNMCCEITYAVSGSGRVFTNEHISPFRQGDIHIIDKGKDHRIICDPDSRLRYIYIGFELHSPETPEFEKIMQLFSENDGTVVRDTGNIRFLLDALINELYKENIFSNIIFKSCIEQILVYIYRLFQNEEPGYYMPDTDKTFAGQSIYRIIRYIDSNIFDIKNVKQIAGDLGYSYGYIFHIFKEKTGETILSYLTKKKIEAAAELLKTGKMSIAEIAEYLNYETPEAFTKVFKKYRGISPSLYRKSVLDI